MNEDTVLSVTGVGVVLSRNKGKSVSFVHDVDFTVQRGRVTGLIGESGSGKSLTCLAVMDLLPPLFMRKGGTIDICGAGVADKDPIGYRARGRKAAMIMQNPMTCFDPLFTIGHHIKETLRAHGLKRLKSRSHICDTLVDLGFDNPESILAAYPFQLSGGMLQRVMVSLALLLDVDLLIADEPTTDLDVIIQAHILDVLDRLKNEKKIGILLVTHDLSVIARLADDVLVMHGGRIIERGEVRKIFTAPEHPYTRSLLAAHFSLYGAIDMVQEVVYESA